MQDLWGFAAESVEGAWIRDEGFGHGVLDWFGFEVLGVHWWWWWWCGTDSLARVRYLSLSLYVCR